MRSSLCLLAMIVATRGVIAQRVDSVPPAFVPVERAALIQCTVDQATTGGPCLSRIGAIRAAKEANPLLAVSAAQVAQARARRSQLRAIPDPIFSSTWEEARGPFGNGATGSHPVSASITIPFPDKFRLLSKIGSADIGATAADSVRQTQEVVAATSAAYDALLAALRRQADLGEMRLLAQDFVERTQGRLDAGTAARLDLLKSQVEAGQAANDLIVAERDVNTAKARLNRLLGRPWAAEILVADTLAIPDVLPDQDRLLSTALNHRPELAALVQERRGARATTSLAKEFWLPDFTIGIGRDFADPGPGVLMTGISLPLPLFYFQHAKGEIAESRWRERELDAVISDARAAIAEEVLTLAAATRAATRQAHFLADELLPTAREAYRIAAASYALGGSATLAVLDARRSLLSAEQQFTDALLEANRSRAELERAVATPLESLGTGVSDDR